MKKLLPLLISVALVLSISLCSLPASAAEVDIPAIGTVTSVEDMMRIAENYVSPTGLYQGDKQYCYLVLFRAAANGITKFSGNLTYNGAFSTVECAASKAITDTSRPDIFSFGREGVTELGSKYLSFSSKSEFTAPAVGADILEYRLQSTEYSDPQRISVSYRSTFGDYSQSNTGATVSKILMGDADGDGQVSSSDALLVLQAAGGKATITGDNAIAADIDRDGKIVTSDALAVLQYTTNELTTFWNHGIISTEENEKIVSGKIYRMRCVDTDKNLKVPASGGAVLSDYERTNNDYKFKFIYLGNGLYKIAEKADSTLVLTTGAGTVKFATYNNSNAGQKWYISSKGGDDFYLSPLSAKYTFLTSSGTTSAEHGYNINGGIWRVYGAEATVYNYFDTGMMARWNLTETQMAEQITNYMNEAKDFFKYMGVDITIATPKHYETTADRCTGTNTEEKLNAQCGHFNGEFTPTQRSHKDNRLMLNELYNEKSANAKSTDIFILWTGHFTWEDEKTKSGPLNYENRVTNGGFSTLYNYNPRRIMMLNIGNSGQNGYPSSFANVDRIRDTVHHELTHTLANVHDSYCSFKGDKVGTGCPNLNCAYCYKETNHRLVDCLMADLTYPFYNHNYDNLLCPVCKTEFLNQYNDLY